MLDKRCKIVLNVLKSSGFTYPRADFQSLEESLIPILPDAGKYKWTFESVSSCIEYLMKHEYVDGEPFFHGYYPVLDYSQLHVTYKGQHYSEFAIAEFRSDIFKSLVLPIVVSLITTLIVSLCGYIWGMSSLSRKNANNNPAAEPIMLAATVIAIR